MAYDGNNGGNRPPYQGGNGGGFPPRNNWQNKGGGGGGNWQNKGGGNSWQNKGGGEDGQSAAHQPPVENPDLYLPYAVTGNKDAPPEIMEALIRIAQKLEENGYILRTGGLEGIEEAVERAAPKHELYLPWRDFASKHSKLTFNTPLAKGIAKKFISGSWDTMKPPVQAFLTKNVRLLTGQNSNSLALFMLCWSKDGAETAVEKTFETGNIGHAILVACAHRIPVFNLGKPGTEDRLYAFLGLK